MDSDFVAHRNHVVEIKCLNDTELVATKYTFDRHTNVFKETDAIAQTFKQKVELLQVREIRELLTGRKIVCAVVVLRKPAKRSTHTSYILSPSFTTHRFIALKKFTLSERQRRKIAQDQHNLFLLDGPCIVLSDGKSLSVFPNPVDVTLKENIHKFEPSDSFKNCDLCSERTQISCCVLHAGHHGDRCIIISIVSEIGICKDHRAESKYLAVIQHYKGCFSELESAAFIPKEYSSSLTCLCIQDLKLESKDAACIFRSKICIGTALGFVVTLQNGRLCNCIQLKEKVGVISLSLYKAADFGQDENIICMLENKAIQLTEFLEVKKSISDVNNVLVGDFQDTGGHELLLLKDDKVPPSSWILTDLGSLYLTSDAVSAVISESKDSISTSLQTVAQALRHKLQARQTDLAAGNQTVHKRNQFLQHLVDKHQCLVGNPAECSIHQQQHGSPLISLVVGKAAQEPIVKQQNGETARSPCQGKQQLKTCRHSCPPLVTKNLWQTTYGENWCIGLDFTCKETRPFNAWLDIVPNQASRCTKARCRPVTCMATASNHSNHIGPHTQHGSSLTDNHQNIYFMSGDHSNKPETSLQNCSVACVTSLPDFCKSADCTVHVFFCYQYLPPDASQSPLLESIQTKRARTKFANVKQCGDNSGSLSRVHMMSVGNICVSVKDVVEGKYELNFTTNKEAHHSQTDVIRRRKVAWQNFQQATRLVVMATPGILLQLPNLLTERCGLVLDPEMNCYIPSHQSLHQVQLKLEPLTSEKHRGLTVYTSFSKPQGLFRLIHHLYANLPEQTLILPEEISSNHVRSTCLPTMHHEVNFLSHGLTRLINHAEADRTSTEEEVGTDDVKQIGESFKRKRDALQTSQDKCLDEEGVSELLSKLEELQDKTDEELVSAGLC